MCFFFDISEFCGNFALCMVLNWIWVGFFIIAFVIALVKLVFLGDYEVFPAMMDSTFSSSKTAFEISLGLTGVLSLWLGIMKIGEKAGAVQILAKIVSPLFSRLFKVTKSLLRVFLDITLASGIAYATEK